MTRLGSAYEWACDSLGLLCWIMAVGSFLVAAVAFGG